MSNPYAFRHMKTFDPRHKPPAPKDIDDDRSRKPAFLFKAGYITRDEMVALKNGNMCVIGKHKGLQNLNAESHIPTGMCVLIYKGRRDEIMMARVLGETPSEKILGVSLGA